MKTIRVEVNKGVLQVLSIPRNIKIKLFDRDSGEVSEITKNPKTGKSDEIITARNQPHF